MIRSPSAALLLAGLAGLAGRGGWSADAPAGEAAAEAAAACRQALAADQAVDAGLMLAHVPAGALHRLLEARVDLGLGHAAEALLRLGAADPPSLPAAIGGWPEALRGEAAQSAAEAAIALGSPGLAPALVGMALAQGGEGVEPDRCLALELAAAEAANDEVQALRAAERLWTRWVRSRYRPRAGLVLAQQLAGSDPTRARELLAEVRALVPSGPVRLAACELLCSILVERHPGQCEVVAAQELERGQGAGAVEVGTLPLWRALALVRLDPQAGSAALRALPPDLAADPAVPAALARAAEQHQVSLAMHIEEAMADAGLGHPDQARAELAPLAAAEPTALEALLALPDADPMPYLGTPAARDPAAAAALAGLLAARHRAGDAWSVVGPLAGDPAQRSIAVLYWASVTAPEAGLQRRLRHRLLALDPPPGVEAGLAWCAEAEDLGGQGQDASAAWAAAAHALPHDHPYLPEAAWRAARGLVAAGKIAEAAALLEGPASWANDDEAHSRCRFLLAQLAFRQGERAEALHAARSLQGVGSPQQQERLDALISSWTSPPSSAGTASGM